MDKPTLTKRCEVPTPAAVGWDGPGRATAVQPRNGMADSCFISCAKINSARGPCGVGSCPALPGKGLVFPGEPLWRGCCAVPGAAGLPGAREAPGVTSAAEERGTISLWGSRRAAERQVFPAKGRGKAGRGSAQAAEPESEAGCLCSHGQRPFPQDAPGKGQDSAGARLLKVAAPGPCGTRVAPEGTEPAALGCQSSCQPVPKNTQGSSMRSR